MAEKLNFSILDINSNGIPVVESIEDEIPKPKKKTKDDDNDDIVNDGVILDEDDPIDDPIDNPDTDEDSVVKVTAEILKAKGVIEFEDDEFEDSEDWLDSKLESSINKKADSILDPTIKELNDKFKNGVPIENLLTVRTEKIKIDKIKDQDLEDNVDLQETLVRQDLELQDYEEDEIDNKIQKYKEADMLKEESIISKKRVKKYMDKYESDLLEHAEQVKQNQIHEKEAQINSLKKTIEKNDEFIKGFKIKKEQKDIIFKGLTNSGKDGYTDFQRAFQNEEMLMKVAQFVLLLNGNIDKAINSNMVRNVKDKITTYSDDKSNKLDINQLRKAMTRLKTRK